jgi:hypothetical protein
MTNWENLGVRCIFVELWQDSDIMCFEKALENQDAYEQFTVVVTEK